MPSSTASGTALGNPGTTISGSNTMPPVKPTTTTRSTNTLSERGRIEHQVGRAREIQHRQQQRPSTTVGTGSGSAGAAQVCSSSTTTAAAAAATSSGSASGVAPVVANPPHLPSILSSGGPMKEDSAKMTTSAAAKSNNTGCVRWCMNVALQSFAGEPWAVNLGPTAAESVSNASFSFPNGGTVGLLPSSYSTGAVGGNTSHSSHHSTSGCNANTIASGGDGAKDANAGPGGVSRTSEGVAPLPRIQTTTAATREERALTHSSAAVAAAAAAQEGSPDGHEVSGATGKSANAPATGVAGSHFPAVTTAGSTTGAGGAAAGGDPDGGRGEHGHSANSLSSATHAVYGSKFGATTTSAQRCGVQLSVVDWDQDEVAAAVIEMNGGGGGPSAHPFGPSVEELQSLQQCVMDVNDPPVTYGCDELLNRITNVEFLPTVVERTDPESGYVDSQMHYHLRSSLEPLLNATVKPAVIATVDHCVSSMVLVYGATQEMKQMGLIGTPEECGLLPHAIRLFMERYLERRETQELSKQQQQPLPSPSPKRAAAEAAATASTGTVISPSPPSSPDGAEYDRPTGSPDSRPTSSSVNVSGFLLPKIGSHRHRYSRAEATFIAFDSSSVVDLLSLDNRHVELVLQLAPPPTPATFDDPGIEDMPRSTSSQTTDSFVLNARVMGAGSTNDALSALDIGLENLSRALEKAALQSESGSSLLFSLTAYTDSGRCATMHVLCLAEDPAVQTWLASTVLARSQAIPLGEEQSWASIQNTPMPPPLHHHAATLLVPALCFGNMFTSALICVYNSMTALSRLSRDLTLAVTGYRMRTMPRVSLASSRRGGKVPLPTGWEEHFTEDGRRYYTDTLTLATTWDDPRFTARPSVAGGGSAHRDGSSGRTGGSGGGDSASGGGGNLGRGSMGGGDAGTGGNDGNSSDTSSSTSGISGGSTDGASIAPSTAITAHRPSRIGLGDGDRDFLANKIFQVDANGAGSGGAVGAALTGSVGVPGLLGNDPRSSTANSLDVGIVVVDAACRPRVVLHAGSANFAQQLAAEERALAAEQTRMAATRAQQEKHERGREVRRQRQEQERLRQQKEEDAREAVRQEHRRRCRDATIAKRRAEEVQQKRRESRDAVANGGDADAAGASSLHSGPSSISQVAHTAKGTPTITAATTAPCPQTQSAAAPDAGKQAQGWQQQRQRENPRRSQRREQAAAELLAATEETTTSGAMPSKSVQSSEAELDPAVLEARAREALASTSFDSDSTSASSDGEGGCHGGGSSRAMGGAGRRPRRPLGDRREGDEHVSGSSNSEGDGSSSTRSSSDSGSGAVRRAARRRTADDFGTAVCDCGGGATMARAAASSAPIAMSINTTKFYTNALQEQVAMSPTAAGKPGSTTTISSSGVNGGGPTVGVPSGGNAPGTAATAFCATAAATSAEAAAPTPEMQDLESLVEEFSVFFRRAYESEQRVRELESELEELRLMSGSRSDMFAASDSSRSVESTGVLAAKSPRQSGERTSHRDDDNAEDTNSAMSPSSNVTRSLLWKIDEALRVHGTPALRERLYPSFARVTQPHSKAAALAPLDNDLSGADAKGNRAAAVAGTHATTNGRCPSGRDSLTDPHHVFKRGINLRRFLFDLWCTTLKQYKDVEGQVRASHQTYYTHRVTQLSEDSRAMVHRWGSVYESEVQTLRQENASLRTRLAAAEAATAVSEQKPGEHGAERVVHAPAPLPALNSLLMQMRALFLSALPSEEDETEEGKEGGSGEATAA